MHIKYILVAALMAYAVTTYGETTTKKVCHEFVENGKKVQRCKTLKIHEKLEGTKIPPKTPSPKPAPAPAKKAPVKNCT